MVSKAKKAQRRQRQLERQRKLQKPKDQETPQEKETPIPAIAPAEPPEGSECGHFQQASLPSIRSALGAAHTLYCKDCNTSAQATTIVRGKGKRKKARNRVLVSTPLSKLWICLQCGNFGCNRELKSHGVSHYESTGHSLALQLHSKGIWCYSCDNYVALVKGVPQHTALHHITDFVTNDLNYRERTKDNISKAKKNTSLPVQLSFQTTTSLLPFIEKVNNVRGEGLRGLTNLGNTCFFNSIMQNMSHLPVLRDYLLDTAKIPKEEGPLTFRLREFMAHMWSSEAGTYNPSLIHSTIVRKAPKFRGFRQQDSHELLQSLLDGVRMEEVDRIRKEQADFPKDKCPITFVDELFGGKLVSCVTCHKCRNTSTVTEQYHDLLLPIPPKGGKPKPKLPKQNRKQNSTEQTSTKAPKTVQKNSVRNDGGATQTKRDNGGDEAERNRENSSIHEDSDKENSETEIGKEHEDAPQSDENEQQAEPHSERGLKDDDSENEVEGLPNGTEAFMKESVENTPDNEEDEVKKGKQESMEAEAEREPADYRRGPIPDNTGSISLMTCLEAFTSPEVLASSEAYNCLTCTRRKYREIQEKLCVATGDYSSLLEEEDIPEEKLKHWVSNTATKQFMIKETPPILTLGLKRFGASRMGLRKIDTTVDFPYEIDLSPFVYKPKNEEDTLDQERQQCFKYYLSGISSHGGGLGGGHYVAYVNHQPQDKKEEGDWYYFSDSHRRKTTLEDTLHTQAYVLFYKRADTYQHPQKNK